MTSRKEKTDLFAFMLDRVRDTSERFTDAEPQAFGRWFLNLYYLNPIDVFISDGSKDGKVDIFFATHNGNSVKHHVLNTKFTHEYNKLAPPAFYEEINYFRRAFENKQSRAAYLEKAVKKELRPWYKKLFEHYDLGTAELMFVTNFKRNEGHYVQVKDSPVTVIHLDELVQFLIDDIDGAMPRTPDLGLTGIHSILSTDISETKVATSIVFARLIDFLRYMDNDPFDLLFNRNVRVAISTSKSPVNKAIRETFREAPDEFAFSNNGITILCEKQRHDPAGKVLTLENPRVVNGSQTLHSIRDVASPSADARVMVRIIESRPPTGDDLPEQIQRRKEIIAKIAVRTNQQNPIKKWDLVSNDEFQLEIYRYFRQRSRFYERREREWNLRSRELRSVGIDYAINIKKTAQFIASYHYQKKHLGPALAKRNLGELFEGKSYEEMRKCDPALVYQIFMVGMNVDECLKDLAKSKRYIEYLAPHANLALFSIIVRALTHSGFSWGTEGLTEILEAQWRDWGKSYSSWRKLTKACLDVLYRQYKKDADVLIRREGYEPTPGNYFKNQSYVGKSIGSALPSSLRKLARKVI